MQQQQQTPQEPLQSVKKLSLLSPSAVNKDCSTKASRFELAKLQQTVPRAAIFLSALYKQVLRPRPLASHVCMCVYVSMCKV
jgi:hypothetical protein